MQIIGITGYKETGKSTAADYLVRTYGFHRIRFAGPLKAMLRAIGLTDEEVDGNLKTAPCAALNGATPRHAMQTLGTEWGRMMIHDDLWLSLFEREVARVTLGKKIPIVCDDCRFANEFDAIRQMGGKIVRVTRPGKEGGTHASESDMVDLDADYSFSNNGSLTELHKKVEGALRLVLNARIERIR